MQLFQCIKRVKAARIEAVTRIDPINPSDAHGPYDVMLEGGDGNPLRLPTDMCIRYAPQAGDYLVEYDDGYRSISPKAAFEAGYIPIVDSDAPTYQELMAGADALATKVDDLTMEVEALKAQKREIPLQPPTDIVSRSAIYAELQELSVTQADANAILDRSGLGSEAGRSQWASGIEKAIHALTYDASRALQNWIEANKNEEKPVEGEQPKGDA